MPPQPKLVYDSHCSFCSRIARWARERSGGRIVTIPFDEVSNVPGISVESNPKSVVWLDEKGNVLRGAHAAYAALAQTGRTWPLRLYERLTPFRQLSDAGYRQVERSRPFLSRLFDFISGPS